MESKKRWIPNLFDEYTFKACYAPSIIIVVPMILLFSLFDTREFELLFKYVNWFLVVRNIGIGAFFILFLIYLIRVLGKYVVEYFLFKDGLKFPTTEMLLWKNRSISIEKKKLLYTKIKNDFNITLCDQKSEAEDEQEARLSARDAVDQIRHFVGDGYRTHQYNIQYGFFRNLAGGIPIALISAILALCLVEGDLAMAIAWVYVVSSVLYLLAFGPLFRRMGNHYAQYLFSEYLSFNKMEQDNKG